MKNKLERRVAGRGCGGRGVSDRRAVEAWLTRALRPLINC
ncbi:hypothetical protein E2C01_076355 [Portunus trituberculatus]|uniref:Uncharacterized protein n=1 Tax=Portunus trituberculatus TaxID=210409 RepID=A0A5B7INC0_PORTR|nr:hypothetical protein [Portunus trituberculatus]